MKQQTPDFDSAEKSPPSTGVPAAGLTRLLRISEVRALTGLGRNTLYRWMSEGMFPFPVSLGGGRVAWRDSDIREWIDSRPRATSIRVASDSQPWRQTPKG